MNPANVDKFVANIASYLKKGWDGVDIDWEYPGVSLANRYSTNPAANHLHRLPIFLVSHQA